MPSFVALTKYFAFSATLNLSKPNKPAHKQIPNLYKLHWKLGLRNSKIYNIPKNFLFYERGVPDRVCQNKRHKNSKICEFNQKISFESMQGHELQCCW